VVPKDCLPSPTLRPFVPRAFPFAFGLAVLAASAAALASSCSTDASDSAPYAPDEPTEPPVQDLTPLDEPSVAPDEPASFLPRPHRPGVPDDATQAIVVTTSSWKDYRGQLRRFERRDGGAAWVSSDGAPITVALGRYGLAWGRGLHPEQIDGPTKFEGDHRSPAGVFDLGEARGYATDPPSRTTWPFQHSGTRSRCMDDPRSQAYNTFISTEGMPLPPSAGIARRETVFEWMLFVMHNTAPVLRGAGSCVFLHVWAKPDHPTQGCVAMSRDDLADLLPWLDLERRPVLVQLPESAYREFQSDWSLPNLDGSAG